MRWGDLHVKLSVFWSPLDILSAVHPGFLAACIACERPTSLWTKKTLFKNPAIGRYFLLFVTDMVSSRIHFQRLQCFAPNAGDSSSDVDICLEDDLRSCRKFVCNNLVGNDFTDPVVQSLS